MENSDTVSSKPFDDLTHASVDANELTTNTKKSSASKNSEVKHSSHYYKVTEDSETNKKYLHNDTGKQVSAVSNDTENPPVPPEKPKKFRMSWCYILTVTGAIVYWYVASMGLTAINKLLFDILGFNYPVLATFIHFTSMSILLRIGFCVCRCVLKELPCISVRNYIRFILPIAFLTAAEIACGNLAYSSCSIGAMTVIKSSMVVLTYLFTLVFRLEKFNWKLFGAVLIIFISISSTVPGMQIKRWIGVMFLCFSVLSAAVRWVIVHYQLRRFNYSAAQLMFLAQPPAACFLVIPACAIDLRRTVHDVAVSSHPQKFLGAAGLLAIAILLALSTIFSEYFLVQYTSSVTMQIGGIGKEIFTILMSVLEFHEVIKLQAAIGISISILGIALYVFLRYQLYRKECEQQHLKETTVTGEPVHSHDEDDDTATEPGKDNVPKTEEVDWYTRWRRWGLLLPQLYKQWHKETPVVQHNERENSGLEIADGARVYEHPRKCRDESNSPTTDNSVALGVESESQHVTIPPPEEARRNI